jgi:hypothetical protein
MSSMAHTAGAVLVCFVWLFSCDQPQPKGFLKRAQFGIFFGGQVQERREVPFELGNSKQTLGFRLEFGEPLRADTDVEWRIDKPAGLNHQRAAAHDKTSPEPERGPLIGKDTARAGETTFDRTLAFEPGDPLGLWNVRVVTHGKVAIDRPFEVYDVKERAKAIRADGGS